MDEGIVKFIENFVGFLSGSIVPLILAIAAMAFFWNVVKLFILKGDDANAHNQARTYALWSLIGFVFIVSIWGLVNMLTSNLFGDIYDAQTTDYSGRRVQLELIHDQLPLAVPCYDLVLVIELTVGRGKHGLRALPTPLT